MKANESGRITPVHSHCRIDSRCFSPSKGKIKNFLKKCIFPIDITTIS